jgi:hypothetical protein
MVHKRKVTDVTLVVRVPFGKDSEIIDPVSMALEIPDVDVVIKDRKTKLVSTRLVDE